VGDGSSTASAVLSLGRPDPKFGIERFKQISHPLDELVRHNFDGVPNRVNAESAIDRNGTEYFDGANQYQLDFDPVRPFFPTLHMTVWSEEGFLRSNFGGENAATVSQLSVLVRIREVSEDLDPGTPVEGAEMMEKWEQSANPKNARGSS